MSSDLVYKEKYLKYKNKYTNLKLELQNKNLVGGYLSYSYGTYAFFIPDVVNTKLPELSNYIKDVVFNFNKFTTNLTNYTYSLKLSETDNINEIKNNYLFFYLKPNEPLININLVPGTKLLSLEFAGVLPGIQFITTNNYSKIFTNNNLETLKKNMSNSIGDLRYVTRNSFLSWLSKSNSPSFNLSRVIVVKYNPNNAIVIDNYLVA